MTDIVLKTNKNSSQSHSNARSSVLNVRNDKCTVLSLKINTQTAQLQWINATLIQVSCCKRECCTSVHDNARRCIVTAQHCVN